MMSRKGSHCDIFFPADLLLDSMTLDWFSLQFFHSASYNTKLGIFFYYNDNFRKGSLFFTMSKLYQNHFSQNLLGYRTQLPEHVISLLQSFNVCSLNFTRVTSPC